MAQHPHTVEAPPPTRLRKPHKPHRPHRFVKELRMLHLKPGDPVRIYRPNKGKHGWLGRYVEPGPHENLAYIAFNNQEKARPLGSQLPELKNLPSQVHSPRTLFPLSQLEKYEQPT